MNARYRRHCTLLGALFFVFWITLAIRPAMRRTSTVRVLARSEELVAQEVVAQERVA